MFTLDALGSRLEHEVARLDTLWDNVEKLVSELKATGITVPTLALDPLIVAAGDEDALSRHAAVMGSVAK